MLQFQERACILVLALLIVPMIATGQGYVEQTGAGNVNWTQQVIKSTGIGAANPNLPQTAQRSGALRAAKLDALRNALEIVKGINLNSETLVENAMLISDVINTRVEGAVKGFRTVDTRYMSTGDVEVDIEVPITGILLDALLPPPDAFGGGALMTAGQMLCPTCGQPWPAGKSVPGGVTLIQSGGTTSGSPSGVYTGLMVDARGLGVRPAMAPKVVDENGQEIYGSKYISRDYAVDIGVVGYEKSPDRARMNERIADNPLVVKAVKASGPNKTDLVISSSDATMIHNAATNMNFLQHCKVMFILD